MATIMATPVAAVPAAVPAGQSPLSGSCAAYLCDTSICCAVLCCPCSVHGAIADGIRTKSLISDPCLGGCNEHCCFFYFCCPLEMAFASRLTLRSRYGVPEDYCYDCMCFHLCFPCQLCVDYKELEMRLPKK